MQRKALIEKSLISLIGESKAKIGDEALIKVLSVSLLDILKERQSVPTSPGSAELMDSDGGGNIETLKMVSDVRGRGRVVVMLEPESLHLDKNLLH